MSEHIRRPTAALMSVYTGIATERERELVRQYIEELTRGLAAATQRAEAAEAALMLVDEYGRNCVHDASLGNDSTSFAVWLVLRESRRQRWRDEAQP